MRHLIAILALLLLASAAWAGNVYMWKDENGVVQLGDKPPANAPSKVESVSGGREVAPEEKNEKRSIELFVTDRCPYCKLAIKHLKSRRVKFKVYNVDEDSRANRRKYELSNGRSGVPFAMIYGRPIMGFSPGAYDKALAAGK